MAAPDNLRDEIAIKVLVELIKKTTGNLYAEDAAQQAYLLADAMLKERAK